MVVGTHTATLESPCDLVGADIRMEVAAHTQSQALVVALGSSAAACHSRAQLLVVAPLVVAGGGTGEA